MNNLFLVFLGGGLGSIVRYAISEFVRANFKTHFPWATLCSNLLSCLLLAITIGYFSEKVDAHPSLRAIILIGFCGGFSTFSTFSYETVELMRSGNTFLAGMNVLISVVVCFALVYFITKQSV